MTPDDDGGNGSENEMEGQEAEDGLGIGKMMG